MFPNVEHSYSISNLTLGPVIQKGGGHPFFGCVQCNICHEVINLHSSRLWVGFDSLYGPSNSTVLLFYRICNGSFCNVLNKYNVLYFKVYFVSLHKHMKCLYNKKEILSRLVLDLNANTANNTANSACNFWV